MRRTDMSFSGEGSMTSPCQEGCQGVEGSEGGRVHPATTISVMHSIARAGKIGFMHF